MTYPELTSILEEISFSIWDNRLWDTSLKTDKPVETYHEGRKSMEEEPPAPIDSLPHKDWLRAT